MYAYTPFMDEPALYRVCHAYAVTFDCCFPNCRDYTEANGMITVNDVELVVTYLKGPIHDTSLYVQTSDCARGCAVCGGD
jgi:hypothetical protein